MGIITIDYDTLILVSVLMFAAIGFFRGWLREGVTTVVLLLLVALLVKPDLAVPIIGYLSKLLKIIVSFLSGGLSLDLDAILKAYKEAPDIFNPDNPYQFLLWVLVLGVAGSYLGGRLIMSGVNALTPLSHLLGGLLGAFNGFIVISLVKEYLLRYVQSPGQPAAQVSALSAQGLKANEVAIAVGGASATASAQGAGNVNSYGLYAAIFLGLILGALILGKVANWDMGKR
ncbi:MAG: hypothetical protein GX605_09240 [Chloroflexi bacterium]|nr:hypothetical protein [Chloroflexota bacterium]